MTSHRHRSLVRQALFAAAGTGSPTRAQIIAAFNTLCDGLFAVLEPVFGSPAVDALFVRSRHLAAKEFPLLASTILTSDRRCSVEALNDSSASDAAEMLSALLAHNIELLVTFLGEDLVMPLVRRAWPVTARPTPDETI